MTSANRVKELEAEVERLRAELIEWIESYFTEVASYDDKKDRWCTDGRRSAVCAGDDLVECGVLELLDGGYGRVQFYRQKNTKKDSE
jgi:hypothetical protein